MILSAVTTFSKLVRGSPMPIMTTLLTMRSPLGACPSALFANHNWPMISATDRLRLKPWRPVEQKVQAKAQPTCEEIHKVPRSSSGINTVSTALPLPVSINHLTVPSSERNSSRICGAVMVARCERFSRSDLARSVICPKSFAPIWCIQRKTCLARNGFSPISAK